MRIFSENLTIWRSFPLELSSIIACKCSVWWLDDHESDNSSQVGLNHLNDGLYTTRCYPQHLMYRSSLLGLCRYTCITSVLFRSITSSCFCSLALSCIHGLSVICWSHSVATTSAVLSRYTTYFHLIILRLRFSMNAAFRNRYRSRSLRRLPPFAFVS